jgi:hypothetical protein
MGTDHALIGWEGTRVTSISHGARVNALCTEIGLSKKFDSNIRGEWVEREVGVDVEKRGRMGERGLTNALVQGWCRHEALMLKNRVSIAWDKIDG